MWCIYVDKEDKVWYIYGAHIFKGKVKEGPVDLS